MVNNGEDALTFRANGCEGKVLTAPAIEENETEKYCEFRIRLGIFNVAVNFSDLILVTNGEFTRGPAYDNFFNRVNKNDAFIFQKTVEAIQTHPNLSKGFRIP